MSAYGMLLILLHISLAAVLAMPDHYKLTPHGRQSHRHPHGQPDDLSAEHPIRHHSRQLGFKDFDENELEVLPLEASKFEQKNLIWNRKRHQRHLDLKSPYVLEEDDFEKRFDAKCGYTVENVPCGGNSCAKKHLRHIKCNHTGMRHGNGLCIQTYRNVMLDCNDSSTGIVRLFTGCVYATQTMMSTLPGVNISQ